jgi:hypothetical protein
MKYKSTVAQAVFDEAMEIVKNSESELRSILARCNGFPEYAAVLSVITDKKLNGFIAAATAAQSIEMQNAGTAAIIAANCQTKP